MQIERLYNVLCPYFHMRRHVYHKQFSDIVTNTEGVWKFSSIL